MAKKYEADETLAARAGILHDARISLAKEMLADNECIDKIVKLL